MRIAPNAPLIALSAVFLAACSSSSVSKSECAPNAVSSCSHPSGCAATSTCGADRAPGPCLCQDAYADGSAGTGGGAGTAGTGGSGGDASVDAPADSGTGGTAADGGDAAVSCDAGLVACGSSCTTTASDPKHCGACGHDCRGGSCTLGKCDPVLIADSQTNPTAISVTPAYVLWVELNDPGRVMHAPLLGGSATPLAASQPYPADVSTGGSTAYWINKVNLAGEVLSVSLSGGTPTPVVGSLNSPSSIASDAADVFFSDENDGTITRAPSTVVASSQSRPVSVALDATHVYWSNFGPAGDAGVGAGAILRVPRSGGTPETLAGGLTKPSSVFVAGGRVFWVTAEAAGTVQSAAVGGGALTVHATAQAKPTSVAADATHVYWVNQTGGSVMRVSLVGGTPETVIPGQSQPISIAVDDTSVYWTNYVGGTVMRWAK